MADRARRAAPAALISLGVLLALSASAAPLEMPELPEMSTYQFGLLKKGPKWTAQRTPAIDSIQAGHMKNIGRMHERGLLVAAGPFLDNQDLRGVFIFQTDSLDLLRSMSDEDPAIRAGRLELGVTAWFAPAGIGRLYKERAARPGARDSMVTFQLGILRKGPKWSDETTAETEAVQIEHVTSILARISSRDYATAGPLFGNTELIGLVIVRGDSARAAQLLTGDPAIRAGRLVAELHPWMTAWGTFPGDTL